MSDLVQPNQVLNLSVSKIRKVLGADSAQASPIFSPSSSNSPKYISAKKVDPIKKVDKNDSHAEVCLKLVRNIRTAVVELLKFISGASAYKGAKQEKFINVIQVYLDHVGIIMNQLEIAGCFYLDPPTLNEVGWISLDPALDETATYSELIRAHRYLNKLQKIGDHASSVFDRKLLRDSFNRISYPRQLERSKSNGHILPQQTVKNVVDQLQGMFPDVNVKMKGPFGSYSLLSIVVGKTLKSQVMLKGLIINSVVTKAFHEDFDDDDISEMLSQSRYLVFRKVTEHCNSAMLHFYSSDQPDVAAKSYLTWFRSYNTLFTSPCRQCGNRLHNCMPSTWRDFKSFDAYHFACRPDYFA